MFNKIIAYLAEFFGIKKEVPIVLPEDVWERMFILAESSKQLKLGPITVNHLDVVVETFTATVDELFMRIEVMIACITAEEDPPDWWKERDRTKYAELLPNFYFATKPGYRDPQQVLEMLVEKVEVIHHLLVTKEMDINHHYYHYMRKEFYSIISDTVEILNVSAKLGNLKTI